MGSIKHSKAVRLQDCLSDIDVLFQFSSLEVQPGGQLLVVSALTLQAPFTCKIISFFSFLQTSYFSGKINAINIGKGDNIFSFIYPVSSSFFLAYSN